MTLPSSLHPDATGLLQTYAHQGRELPAYLRDAIEKLSAEHPCGLSLSQLETPMMKQYASAKEAAPDALLMFRMGDFFESFGLDAILLSDICQLTLTSRDKSSQHPVAMAGVPVVSYRAAVKKCVLAGFKVAICDQLEDPKLTKTLVKREIVRIATPALPGDWDENESPTNNCYLACAWMQKATWTLGYVDASVGDFKLTSRLSEQDLIDELSAIRPKEILVKADQIQRMRAVVEQLGLGWCRITPSERWIENSEQECQDLLTAFFGSKAYYAKGIHEISYGMQVICSILWYLKNTQKDVLKNITDISCYDVDKYLGLDDSTRKHLELFETSTGEKRGSLFYFLDHCLTAGGSRALFERLNHPSKDVTRISEQLRCIDSLKNRPSEYFQLQELLKKTSDLNRCLAKTAQRSFEPRSLALIRDTLGLLPNILSLSQSLFSFLNTNDHILFKDFFLDQDEIEGIKKVFQKLDSSLLPEPAHQQGKGPIFQPGHSAELDECIDLETNVADKIQELETNERQTSGISTLKIGYTRAFGYYFEISKGKLANIPQHFMRKQTLTNGERFITSALKNLEDKIAAATERRCELERQLLENLRQEVIEQAQKIQRAATVLAHTDLVQCFTAVSLRHGWCRPEITAEPCSVVLDCVHPILKEQMHARSALFIANDISVGHMPDAGSILLITGPNMAGKSTIMRQLGLAQILCQMGCYVPAQTAQMGVADRIMTRIGSGDHALKGQSTFLVEMLEAARMLRCATPQSLLLIDELGRGTSTYDGMALAWSILEDLHDRVKARVLFSTHYHELVGACAVRTGIQPMQMEVIEAQEQITFSHKFTKGAAGKSYGIHVAELAGIPESVLARARILMHGFEKTPISQATEHNPPDIIKVRQPIRKTERLISTENLISLFDQ